MVGFQGESPADRRALEGAASRSFRDVQAMFKRVRESEEERASASLTRRFKQTNFRHRPQAAGPIRASVQGGAPPARLFFFLRHLYVTTNNLFLPLYKNSYQVYTFIISPHSLSY